MNSFEPLTVQFFDTTLRDGAQALPDEHQFMPGSKPEIADAIARLGVHTIEAGFPATKGDGEEVADVARTVGNTTYTVTPRTVVGHDLVDGTPYTFTPVITGLSRANPGDIDAVWGAVQDAKYPGIHTFVATAPDHMRAKHPNKTPEQIHAMGVQAVQYARSMSTPDTVVEFSCEAATGSDIAFVERVVRDAIQAGANVINLPDTLGRAGRMAMFRMFSAATRWVIAEGVEDSVMLSAHNHNDLARAVANTVSAMQAVEQTAHDFGVKPPTFQAEVTQGGFGERAGNTPFESTVAAMMVDANNGEFITPPRMRIDTTRIIPTVEFVFAQTGLAIPGQHPIAGTDTRTHRSGIHAAGVLSGGASIYSPFNPVHFGANEPAIIATGKYQGARGRTHIGAVNSY